MHKFWKKKSLLEMSAQEWESLCDGCARCCLHKIENEATEEIHYTSVVCKYLGQDKCVCTRYEDRTELVSDCIKLTPKGTANFGWLPNTCAYRLVAEGKDLKWWHPLVSGSSESVHEAGISVKGKCISELYVHPHSVEEYIIKWVEQGAGETK